MTICLFGIYDSNYNRNRVVIQGLKKNNVEIIECNSRQHGFTKYISLCKKHWKIRGEYDALFVCFPGCQSVILAKLITSKPIIFDALTSLYDSEVLDREKVEVGSMKAIYFWLLDWLSIRAADQIITDTVEHAKYYSKIFKAPFSKFHRLFVGSDYAKKPAEIIGKKGRFTVHFHASYIPLQGVQHVLEAARLLKSEDIQFNIVGSKIKKKYEHKYNELRNVAFINNLSSQQLKRVIINADLCLGIFGTTEKAKRVIPNKIYEAIALAKPVITMRSPAIQELFKHNELFLVECGSSSSIALKIKEIYNDKCLLEESSKKCHQIFKQKARPEVLGKKLKTIITQITK